MINIFNQQLDGSYSYMWLVKILTKLVKNFNICFNSVGDSLFLLWMTLGEVEPLYGGISLAITSSFVLYSEIIEQFIFNNNSLL